MKSILIALLFGGSIPLIYASPLEAAHHKQRCCDVKCYKALEGPGLNAKADCKSYQRATVTACAKTKYTTVTQIYTSTATQTLGAKETPLQVSAREAAPGSNGPVAAVLGSSYGSLEKGSVGGALVQRNNQHCPVKGPSHCIPKYASKACKPKDYASACSCLGYPATTTTIHPKPTTITTTLFGQTTTTKTITPCPSSTTMVIKTSTSTVLTTSTITISTESTATVVSTVTNTQTTPVTTTVVQATSTSSVPSTIDPITLTTTSTEVTTTTTTFTGTVTVTITEVDVTPTTDTELTTQTVTATTYTPPFRRRDVKVSSNNANPPSCPVITQTSTVYATTTQTKTATTYISASTTTTRTVTAVTTVGSTSVVASTSVVFSTYTVTPSPVTNTVVSTITAYVITPQFQTNTQTETTFSTSTVSETSTIVSTVNPTQTVFLIAHNSNDPSLAPLGGVGFTDLESFRGSNTVYYVDFTADVGSTQQFALDLVSGTLAAANGPGNAAGEPIGYLASSQASFVNVAPEQYALDNGASLAVCKIVPATQYPLGLQCKYGDNQIADFWTCASRLNFVQPGFDFTSACNAASTSYKIDIEVRIAN